MRVIGINHIYYQENPYYKSGNTAIIFLKLRNDGRTDAEEIKISATFPAPITDIFINDKTLSMNIDDGEKVQNLSLQ